MKLYQITEAYRSLANRLIECDELPPEAEALVDQIQDELAVKVRNIVAVSREFRAREGWVPDCGSVLKPGRVGLGAPAGQMQGTTPMRGPVGPFEVERRRRWPAAATNPKGRAEDDFGPRYSSSAAP